MSKPFTEYGNVKPFPTKTPLKEMALWAVDNWEECKASTPDLEFIKAPTFVCHADPAGAFFAFGWHCRVDK